MAQLLKKLRLDYSSLTMLSGITTPPKEGTSKFHSRFINGFNQGENDECFVSDEERSRMQDKTNRQLRLREMLKEHSKKANLIVMSMPMPRRVRKSSFAVNYLRKLFDFFSERSVSATLHVMAGGAVTRHATNALRPWQSNLRLDLLLITSH